MERVLETFQGLCRTACMIHTKIIYKFRVSHNYPVARKEHLAGSKNMGASMLLNFCVSLLVNNHSIY